MRRFNILHIAVLAAVVALLAFPMAAFADEVPGKSWQVTFTSQDKMVETYPDGDVADSIAGMQPGDSIKLTVNLKHENASSADWYMSNKVLDAMETAVAQGSAYRYHLTYTGPGSPSGRDLYDSERVGGDATQGLYDATNNLEEYFYLDTLSQSQPSGVVELTITLDGETESNAYFNKDAVVKMNFAVEKVSTSNTNPVRSDRNVVQTGDDSNLTPYFIIMGVSGVLLLALAIVSLRIRSRERKEGLR